MGAIQAGRTQRGRVHIIATAGNDLGHDQSGQCLNFGEPVPAYTSRPQSFEEMSVRCIHMSSVDPLLYKDAQAHLSVTADRTMVRRSNSEDVNPCPLEHVVRDVRHAPALFLPFSFVVGDFPWLQHHTCVRSCRLLLRELARIHCQDRVHYLSIQSVTINLVARD
jgi:hypothetical protein